MAKADKLAKVILVWRLCSFYVEKTRFYLFWDGAGTKSLTFFFSEISGSPTHR